MVPILASLLLIPLFLFWYVRFLNRSFVEAPPEAIGLVQERWTQEQIRAAYKKAQESPTDVKPFLRPKTGRRYIVVGGAGNPTLFPTRISSTGYLQEQVRSVAGLCNIYY